MYKFLLVFVFLAFFIALHIFINTVAYPNTKVGTMDVSFKNKKEIQKLLEKEEKKNIVLSAKERKYTIPLLSIGVHLNKKSILDTVFTENNKPFPRNYLSFFKSFYKKRIISPTLTFTPEFRQRLDMMTFDFTKEDDVITFNESEKSFELFDNQQKYKIDTTRFQFDIISAFGKSNTIITAYLTKIPSNSKFEQVAEYNKKLALVYSKPVSITIDGTDKKVELSPPELKSVLGASYKVEEKNIDLAIDENKVSELLKNKELERRNGDRSIDLEKVKTSLLSLLKERFAGQEQNSVTASMTFSPNTDGSVARKYIEVDISQQRMYRFENGKIIAEHVVSTGLYYPTPTGKFKILNKAKNAFSDIYNVWMPYWMAIYFDPKVKAYIGIHELPYWYSGGGIQRRPREFLGTPRTGGCISLDMGTAKEVQDWSEIGMPVHVYN